MAARGELNNETNASCRDPFLAEVLNVFISIGIAETANKETLAICLAPLHSFSSGHHFRLRMHMHWVWRHEQSVSLFCVQIYSTRHRYPNGTRSPQHLSPANSWCEHSNTHKSIDPQRSDARDGFHCCRCSRHDNWQRIACLRATRFGAHQSTFWNSLRRPINACGDSSHSTRLARHRTATLLDPFRGAGLQLDGYYWARATPSDVRIRFCCESLFLFFVVVGKLPSCARWVRTAFDGNFRRQ